MFKTGPRAALVSACLLLELCHPARSRSADLGFPAPMTESRVVQVLDQTIDWYRSLGLQSQVANEPSDLLFLYDDRQIAAKVMALAFEVGRADADLLSANQPPPTASAGDSGLSPQALAQIKQSLETQEVKVRADLAAAAAAMHAGNRSRVELGAKVNELQGVLDLIATKKNVLATMTDFTQGSGDANADSLRAQIDAMAVAIPSTPLATPTAAPAAASPAATAIAATVDRFGLWDLAANAVRLSEKSATIAALDRTTAALQDTVDQLRGPLLEAIKALSSRGDALAAAATGRDDLDRLAQQFKQASAVLLPLSREGLLLSQYRRNLHNWRGAVQDQYRQALRRLGIRLAVVLGVLAVIFAAADLWRRMVLRYVQDTRRRHQFLLMRRIAVWSLIILVIGASFASELGSIATFAGLITAGIAVAMQSVLVSIVGYFFLIGKYGIRVGDRVQIGEVVGEVIDLGLVRMYLMELSAKGVGGPTGRVVAFANSVVFQVSSGLFKQIPGVNFTWREVVLNLPADADPGALKLRLTEAVTAALADYHDEIQRQTEEIQRTTRSASAGDAHPQVQLRFSASGVEAHVRYPVHLRHAAEIDERVTEALSHVVAAVAVR